MSNSLNPDQAGQNVGPDLGSNYLQRLSAHRKDNCYQTELLTLTLQIYRAALIKIKKTYGQPLHTCADPEIVVRGPGQTDKVWKVLIFLVVSLFYRGSPIAS